VNASEKLYDFFFVLSIKAQQFLLYFIKIKSGNNKNKIKPASLSSSTNDLA